MTKEPCIAILGLGLMGPVALALRKFNYAGGWWPSASRNAHGAQARGLWMPVDDPDARSGRQPGGALRRSAPA